MSDDHTELEYEYSAACLAVFDRLAAHPLNADLNENELLGVYLRAVVVDPECIRIRELMREST